jgi:hypothetical protein
VVALQDQPRRALLVLCLLGVWGCGRVHELNEGSYALTAEEVIRDECRILSSPDLSGGAMVFAGDVARMDYQFAQLELQLVGAFFEQGSTFTRGLEGPGQPGSGIERFSMDGSAANVNARVDGAECLLDLVTVHLDGTTRSPSLFDGVMLVRYEPRRSGPCSCELWARYRAEQQP